MAGIGDHQASNGVYRASSEINPPVGSLAVVLAVCSIFFLLSDFTETKVKESVTMAAPIIKAILVFINVLLNEL
jgi:hypothetical protein